MKRLAVLCCAVALAACGGGGDGSTVAGTVPSTPGPAPAPAPAPSALNTAPVAHAGTAQSVTTGSAVTLDGSASSDADKDLLTYAWTLNSKPSGSVAALSGATTAKPSFTVDLEGSYTLSLVVNDGKASSTTATVAVTATPAQTQASCSAWLATDPNPSGVRATPTAGTSQRSALLAAGGKLVILGTRYYAVYIPSSFYTASAPSVVFELPGTGGYPEAGWSDWNASMAEKGHAFISLYWGGGTGDAASDTQIYSDIKQIVQTVGAACPIAGKAKWLMGFSVGSAYSFAVVVRDVADQKLFKGQLAISGAAISPLVSGRDLMHATVEGARSDTSAVQGIKSWMYCGEKDFDHGWSMCTEMPNGESFINTHGGSATLYKDANGTHNSLPSSATGRNQMFDFMAR